MSANTDYYWNKLQQAEKNTVGPYQSKYGTQIDSTLNKIVNRQPFTYDFNADPLYQNYKDQYTKLGNEAAMNAVANASALSGGYGNSYAATAGAQANQQYLTRLNQIIPDLYNAAMNKYNMEGEQLNNVYATLSNADAADYGKYRDQVADYNTNLNYLQGAYGTQLSNDQWQANYDYNKQRDAIADQQWQQQYDYQKQKYEQEMAYKKERDAAADAQWQAEFALKQAAQAAQAARSTAAQYSGGGSSSSAAAAPTVGHAITPTANAKNSTSEYQQMSTKDIDAATNVYRQVLAQTGAHEQAEYALADYLAKNVSDKKQAMNILNKILG